MAYGQQGAVTGRRRNPNYTAALNARLGGLPGIISAQQTRKHQKAMLDINKAAQAETARANRANERFRQKQQEQEEKGQRISTGLTGLGTGLSIFQNPGMFSRKPGGGLFGLGGKKVNPVTSQFSRGGRGGYQAAGAAGQTFQTGFGTSPTTHTLGLDKGQLALRKSQTKPTGRGGLDQAAMDDVSGPGPADKGWLSKTFGSDNPMWKGLNAQTTLGSGMLGFGAGSLFGGDGKNRNRKLWKSGLAGAGIGSLAGLFSGGGMGALWGGLSGGLGGLASAFI